MKIKYEKEDLMKHPLWILNSALLLLFIITLFFIFVSQEKIPARESIEPEAYITPIKKEITKINISKIYEDDLFGTFKEKIEEITEIEEIIPMPKTPTPQPVIIPELPQPTFLEPLQITLKGIIIVSYDETKNRVIIADNKTNLESVYKVGDTIEDSQLIRIFSTKVIFIRSNGQQEVLYLREKDAMTDPAYAVLDDWDHVVQRISDKDYLINPDIFVSRVKNLAQFIDMLDLTTVYKKGKIFGCRIGHIHENGLGLALGFRLGDIILEVNSIPATDTQNRFKIYKEIVAMHYNDTIAVTVLRNNREVAIHFTLQEFKKQDQIVSAPELIPRASDISSLKKEYNFAPTVQEIKAREREHMLKKGKKPFNSIQSR